MPSLFEVYFERNYSPSSTTRRHQTLQWAQVLDRYVVDIEGDESRSKDRTAHDYPKQVAIRIPAPSKSFVSAAIQVGLSLFFV